MRRAGGGSIIVMSSVAGPRGSAGLAGYCATKGGVRLFAKAVAMECVPRLAMGVGSTPSTPGSSTRRFGRSYQPPPGAMRRLIRTRWPKRGIAGQGWAGARYRQRGALPRLGCVQLYDGCGACDRRRHDGRRQTSLELNWAAREKATTASAKCDFSGISHRNISIESSIAVCGRQDDCCRGRSDPRKSATDSPSKSAHQERAPAG
jgi:hypothetical protein